ncbi:decarboxylase [Streptomyces caatingaensis]|uniref:Decarboxylase n=1 Tax=Streptomyces caatingaensis TaxID=1678637 RepID=A0A0K9XBY2_9ACTN|nr:decarboxylase [Streptomyces caatingaensis]KNB50925.1 decarboxylase [Streptomyces caatingaensis]
MTGTPAQRPTAADLARRYGTPLYVYDLDRVVAARRDLRAALPESFTLYYSFKANPHPELARALREIPDGPCRAEVCSEGELDSALTAGFPAAEILYGGPGKTDGEITHAVAAGVRTFSVESLGDLRRVGAVAREHGVTADCLLRVNDTSSAGATSLRMTGAPSQFGIDRETLAEQAAELSAVPGTRLVGLHFFPLSNARDEDGLIREFRQSIATAAALHTELGLPLRVLDLGGGFAAPYAVPGERPVYGRLRAALEDALDTHLPRWRTGEIHLACESGRYLVGDCGELVVGVTNVKESRGRTFAVADGGVNTLGGMAGLGRLLPLAVRLDEEPGRATRTATLVGPLCTPGDILGRDVELPDPAPGDLVTVPNVGAYGATASLLLFLSRPAPVEAVVRGAETVSVTRLVAQRTPVGPGN